MLIAALIIILIAAVVFREEIRSLVTLVAIGVVAWLLWGWLGGWLIAAIATVVVTLLATGALIEHRRRTRGGA